MRPVETSKCKCCLRDLHEYQAMMQVCDSCLSDLSRDELEIWRYTLGG